MKQSLNPVIHLGSTNKPSLILIVDDVPDNLRVLSQTLTASGYEVRNAINGELAIMSIATNPPDLILLDITMPGLDGYEVCRKLKADPTVSDIPIIFISALGAAHDKVQAFEMGGTDYITKPFQISEVQARVAHQLELRQLRQTLSLQNQELRDALHQREQAETEIRQLNQELEKRVQERTLELQIANQTLQSEMQERHQAQAKLLHMALYDSLTGCATRTQLLEKIDVALEKILHPPHPPATLILLDCDRFATINETLGHLKGDQLLMEIAQRIVSVVPQDSLVARLRGDEFAILLTSGSLEIETLVVAIQQDLVQPIKLGEYEVSVNASIGIVEANRHYHQAEHILRDCYQAKERAKHKYPGSCWQIFKPEMHDQALHQLTLEGQLRHAIEQQKLQVYYQPIVDLTSYPSAFPIVGFEALVRWQPEANIFISPTEFIPLAEETGLIVPLGSWVLQTAAQQISKWNQIESIPTDLFVSVNFSACQLSSPEIANCIDNVIKHSNCKPSWLKLEITESSLMGNSSQVIDLLSGLRKQGFKICIDDFGTGYSSLNYLRSLPIDTLKIDRTFVWKLESEPESKKILEAILSLSKALDLEVIAEGIETDYQARKISEIRRCLGQGYLFSRPMDSEKVTASLKQKSLFL